MALDSTIDDGIDTADLTSDQVAAKLSEVLNASLGSDFGDKVLRKITSNIQTVGAKLEQKVNEMDLKENFTLSDFFGDAKEFKENNDIYKNVQKAILKNLNELKINSDKVQFKDFNLNTLFGVAPKMGWFASNQFGRIRLNALSIISNAIKPENLKFKDFNLDTLFGVTPKMGWASKIRFNTLRNDIIKEVRNSIGYLNFKEFDLNALFGTIKDGPFARIRFNKTRNDILAKIRDIFNLGKIQFKDFDLNTLFGIIKEGPFARYRFNKIRNDILAKIRDQIEKKIQLKEFDLNTLFGDQKMGVVSRVYYQKSLIDIISSFKSSIISKIKESIKKIEMPKTWQELVVMIALVKGASSSLGGLIAIPSLTKMMSRKTGIDKKETEVDDTKTDIKKAKTDFFEDKPVVILGGFTDKALNDIKDIIAGKKVKGVEKKEEKETPNWMKWLMGTAALGALATGLYKLLEPYLGDIFKAMKEKLVNLGGKMFGKIEEWLQAASDFTGLALSFKEVKAGWKQFGTMIFDNLVKIPPFSWLAGLCEGIGMIIGGDIKGGLIKIGKSFPGISLLIDIGESLGTATSAATKDGGFSFKKFINVFNKTFSEKIYESLPGLLKSLMRVDDNGILVFKSPSEIKDVFNEWLGITSQTSELGAGEEYTSTVKAYMNEMRKAQEAGNTEEYNKLQGKLKKYEYNQGKGNKPINVAGEPTTQDFIWRPGAKQPIKFSDQDNIIGFKKELSFKEAKDINLNIQKLNTLMEENNGYMKKLINVSSNGFAGVSKAQTTGRPLDGIPENVDMRDSAMDKAYNLRTQAWSILHGVV